MRLRLFAGCLALMVGLETSAVAQFREAQPRGTKLGASAVQYWRAGMIITARSGPCRGLVGTAPIPVDWPEQEARIVDEDFSPAAKISYRMVEGTVKQMVVEIPFLPYGEECRAIVTVEVKRHSQLAPEKTDIFVLPEKRKLPRAVRQYLGPSPGIECTNSRIKSQAKKLKVDGQTAWEKVEAIYDWVRENVQQKQGNEGGAAVALRGGKGDHEDLASLFIALCRASDVPARMVWVQGHCYPEFYLQDEEGGEYWFPCQVAGPRAFGSMPDHRLILQKGDNFRSPTSRRERKRYLPETLNGAGGKPSVKFIRELVSR